MTTVWYVRWPDGLDDLDAVYSTREKATDYIEEQLDRLNLNDYRIDLHSDGEVDDFGIWSYLWNPSSRPDIPIQMVTASEFPIDA